MSVSLHQNLVLTSQRLFLRFFSAAGEDEVGEGPFAYGPLGQDFIQASFLNLEAIFLFQRKET